MRTILDTSSQCANLAGCFSQFRKRTPSDNTLRFLKAIPLIGNLFLSGIRSKQRAAAQELYAQVKALKPFESSLSQEQKSLLAKCSEAANLILRECPKLALQILV